ncbi:MAG TPA: PsiF family protein [Burkholderiaceae bacterium]|nr:PsiF family protein [Burkholderiaceae bacterium]
MKRLMTVLALSLAAASLTAQAADEKKQPTAQQDKMTQCNKDAGEMKGDERKAFMSKCLSAKKPTQQEKMTQCNKDAGEMKGDERKAFMSKCLKG